MELDAITGCVIGGVSLKGGRVSVLLNGMTLLAVSPGFNYIVRRLVLSLAVWMDVKLSR